MYICNNCNYETTDKSNFNHHNKSKKHLFNIQDQLSSTSYLQDFIIYNIFNIKS